MMGLVGKTAGQGASVNTEQLHNFELAYRERNFSAAARLVPCTPQGLSKSIHALEKELDVTLFENDPETGLPVPTEYAHELFEYACVNDSNLRLLGKSFDRIRSSVHYEVALSCSLGIVGVLGPEFFKSFHALQPGIKVTYWEANDAVAEKALFDGVSDLALLVGPFSPECTVRELFRAPVYFWVAADDPLAQRDHLTIADFAGRDIAIPGGGFHCHERLLGDACSAGVELGDIYEMSEIFQDYEFVLEGRGLGFSVRHLVDLPAFAENRRVRALPCEGWIWTFGIVRLATHALDPAEQLFWDWCVNYARRLPSDPVAVPRG